MREFTKSEKRIVKDIIRKGVLRRHAEWQRELRELLDRPFDEDCNEFDLSMEIADKARRFYKEAMQMEDFYRNSFMVSGLACLLRDGYLTDEDIDILPEEIQQTVFNMLR